MASELPKPQASDVPQIQPAAVPAEPAASSITKEIKSAQGTTVSEVSAAPSPKPAFVLPGAIYSPQLLESVIYDIQIYLDWYRQNVIRRKVGAKPKDEPNHSDETVVVIEAWLGGKPATLEALEDLLAYLKGLKLPQVHIMLAALPNRSQREALVGWFRTNVGPGLLLSFVADRNLGGGLVVRTPNRVFDYTWKQQLVAARSKLAEILKRV